MGVSVDVGAKISSQCRSDFETGPEGPELED